MTVERNASLSLELEGRSREEMTARARETIGMVGLDFDTVRDRLPWQLSGGQRQRVGLARALAFDPPVLLMDEAFGALDPLTRAEMQAMLKNLLKGMEKTVLLVTHDLDEALYLADRVLFLADGEVFADLKPSEVLASFDPHVREYVSAVHRTVKG
jgi:osmoprotectant transport system ATP-binding protein